MKLSTLTDIGLLQRYCVVFRRNLDVLEPDPTADLGALLLREILRRCLTRKLIDYLPLYLHWHEQRHNNSSTAALLALEQSWNEGKPAT